MAVARLSLEYLLGSVESLGPEAFVAANPGLFLVAMGRLSAAEIRAHTGTDEDETLPIHIGPAHDVHGSHPLAGQVFHIGPHLPRPIRVGRGSNCDIRVPDESVSDLHCQLEVSEKGFLVQDMKSTNGTSINGVRIRAGGLERVADGELLSVARYSFQVLTASSLRTMLSAIRGSPPELG